MPNMGLLATLPTRGIIVTSLSQSNTYGDEKVDFVSRFFAPSVGVDEDPVTGSAHCCLAPYWSALLDRAILRGFQASQRGGVVDMTMAGDRVKLRGCAVTTLVAELTDIALED